MCSGWGGLLFMTTLDSLHNKRVNEQITTLPLETVWSHGSAKTDEGEASSSSSSGGSRDGHGDTAGAGLQEAYVPPSLCPPTSACSVPYRHESLLYKGVFGGTRSNNSIAFKNATLFKN